MAADRVFSDLSRMIETVGRDKGIDKQIVIDAVIQGMLLAARKKWGTYRDIEAQYNEESGEVELFQFMEVVTDEEFVDDEVEMKLSEALELDPSSQVHDSVGTKIDTDGLGRIAAQTAKQIIVQKVRDAEREIIFNEFEERKGEIAFGIARRVERGSIVVDMGRAEAHIPPREQISGEVYQPGSRIQGYISDVRLTSRGPVIIMSRSDDRYLMKLFEMEVPEIYDGVVEIVAAAREPGARAKIAVVSKDSSVDALGACVGMKGSRVQNVIQELKGEKIDIVLWDENPARFVCNALSPAEVSKVFLDEAKKEMEVVVPDHQLSLAIGRKGQNVRLAARLTGWKLDILSDSDSATKTAEAIFNLMLIPEMTDTMAQNVLQSGFGSFQVLASVTAEDVAAIPGYDDLEKAQNLVNQAKKLVEEYAEEGKEIPKLPVKKSLSKIGGKGATGKAKAEDLLMQEMEALSKKEAEEEAEEKKKSVQEGGELESGSAEESVPEGKTAKEEPTPAAESSSADGETSDSDSDDASSEVGDTDKPEASSEKEKENENESGSDAADIEVGKENEEDKVEDKEEDKEEEKKEK